MAKNYKHGISGMRMYTLRTANDAPIPVNIRGLFGGEYRVRVRSRHSAARQPSSRSRNLDRGFGGGGVGVGWHRITLYYNFFTAHIIRPGLFSGML